MGSLLDALRGSWLRLRFYLFRARYDREMEEEMRHHLELRAAEYAREGMAPAEARDAAQRRFGNRTVLQEQRRSVVGVTGLEALGQDMRYVVRSLRSSPGFAAMVVLTLGLGIGANATMFGIIDRLLLSGPAHLVDANRVVRLYSTERRRTGTEYTGSGQPYALYTEMRDARVFEGVAAYWCGRASVGRGRDAREIAVCRATSDFFPLLGVRPAVGRFFGPEEDRPPRGDDVVVLDAGYWWRAFGGDPDVLGRTLDVDGSRYRIVGVAPEGFTGATLEPTDVWLPMSAGATRIHPDWATTWTVTSGHIIARLRPGVTLRQAGAEATAAHRRAYIGPADFTIATARLSVQPLRYDNQGREPPEIAVSRWAVGVAAVLLLVASANAGNLVLARTLRRRREIAVRLALGISGGRLARLLLAESVLLSLVSGGAGLLLAVSGGQFIRRLLLPGIEWGPAAVDERVFALTAIAALVTGTLVGLVAALYGRRGDLTTALKAGVREGGGQRSRLRAALTIAQAALSVVLLVGGGLFVRSLWKVRSLHLGVEPDRVLVVDVADAWAAGRAELTEPDEARGQSPIDDLYARALERVRAIPGVEAASLTIGTPFQSSFSVGLAVSGHDSLPRHPTGGPYVTAVTSDYFRTVGTRLLRGRTFTPAEGRGADRVAVINQTMARILWPDGDAIGQCLFMNDQPCSRVVGIVEDARRFQLTREDAGMQYYIPLGQQAYIFGTMLLVRPAGSPESMIGTIRRELQQLAPGIGYVSVRSLQEIGVDWQVRPWRLGATLFAAFGALALLVAAIGLYSLIAYLVAQRTHEFGVRMALGARGPDIARLVMGRGVGAAVIGLAAGVMLALALGRFVEPLLFRTSPRDLGVFAVVSATLLTFAALASLVPTWRATQVDPVIALRSET